MERRDSLVDTALELDSGFQFPALPQFSSVILDNYLISELLCSLVIKCG